MSDLKELTLQLIQACEQICLERTLLETMMEGAKVPGWKKMFESLKDDAAAKATIHEQFQPLYDVVQRESGADKALQELLRVLPKHGPTN
jgi:hypothetical protein